LDIVQKFWAPLRKLFAPPVVPVGYGPALHRGSYIAVQGKCGTYETVGPNEHLNIAPPIHAVNFNFLCESEIAFTFLFLRRKTTG